MRKILNFIKRNWTDPVWSKVFAAGIIALISSLSILVWSLAKKIPFSEILGKTYTYLTTNKIELSYLTLAIILIFILIILIPLVGLKIVSFQLKNLKLPRSLKSPQFNLEELLNGTWECQYKRISNGAIGKEVATIKEGNKYYLNNKLYFVLTNPEIVNANKQISWDKTTYPHNAKHSRETLQILSNKELRGTDDQGYEIKYTKI